MNINLEKFVSKNKTKQKQQTLLYLLGYNNLIANTGFIYLNRFTWIDYTLAFVFNKGTPQLSEKNSIHT